MSNGQHQVFGGHGGDGEDTPEATATGQIQVNTEGVDDLLAEIDGLLETNAEEFVRSYVQKGGE